MRLNEALAEAGDSTLCVSLSSNPGTFGMKFHTTGYKVLGLNMKYVACYEDNIHSALDTIRFNSGKIRGASLSMPFKQVALPLVDEVSDHTRILGSINTIVNERSFLKGYNTDVDGFAYAWKMAKIDPHAPVTILGSGGAAKAIAFVLKGRSKVEVISRNVTEGEALAERYGFSFGTDFSSAKGFIVNCTPIGMTDEILPINFDRADGLFDIIVRQTPSVKKLLDLKKPAFDGSRMAFGQAATQFKLYTGVDAPVEEIEKAIYGT